MTVETINILTFLQNWIHFSIASSQSRGKKGGLQQNNLIRDHKLILKAILLQTMAVGSN